MEAAARRAPPTHKIGGNMSEERGADLGTLNALLFEELERLNGCDLGDEDASGRKVLVFEPDGKPEMSEEMTVRRIVDGR